LSDLSTNFAEIREAMSRCVDRSVSERAAELGSVHALDTDLGLWAGWLPNDTALGVARAQRELAHAEHAAASGLYRQAFGSLRLFLELTFAAVYFSANELERRLWLSDQLDFSWSKALHEDTGVLSSTFVDAFTSGLSNAAKGYAVLAAQSYRYCSQFVHGKAAESWTLPDTVSYDARLLEAWCAHAQDAGNAALFALLVRHGDDLVRGHAAARDAEAENDLLDAIQARFARHEEVRKLIGHAHDA
jgi:hypothetical protein